MKKQLAMTCAALLCTCSLGLAACGSAGSSAAASSAAASSEAASAAASSEAVSSAAAESGSASASAAAEATSYIGTWQLAAAEVDGITIAGGLSALFGDDFTINMKIDEDGTGAIALSDEEASFTWEEAEANELIITLAADDEASEDIQAVVGNSASDRTVEATFDGEAIILTMESDGTVGNLYFTADGTLASANIIDAASALPITDEATLIGSWNLAGINTFGMSMYGESDDLAAIEGFDEPGISFAAGGKCTFAGKDASYTVTANGAAVTADDINIEAPVLSLNDGIIVDLSEALGGIPTILYYTK